MSPGLLTSSVTGRWLRLSHSSVVQHHGAINSRQRASQTFAKTGAVYQCVSLVADSRNLNLPGHCFPRSQLQLVDLQDTLSQLGIWTKLRRAG